MTRIGAKDIGVELLGGSDAACDTASKVKKAKLVTDGRRALIAAPPEQKIWREIEDAFATASADESGDKSGDNLLLVSLRAHHIASKISGVEPMWLKQQHKTECTLIQLFNALVFYGVAPPRIGSKLHERFIDRMMITVDAGGISIGFGYEWAESILGLGSRAILPKRKHAGRRPLTTKEQAKWTSVFEESKSIRLTPEYFRKLTLERPIAATIQKPRHREDGSSHAVLVVGVARDDGIVVANWSGAKGDPLTCIPSQEFFDVLVKGQYDNLPDSIVLKDAWWRE